MNRDQFEELREQKLRDITAHMAKVPRHEFVPVAVGENPSRARGRHRSGALLRA